MGISLSTHFVQCPPHQCNQQLWHDGRDIQILIRSTTSRVELCSTFLNNSCTLWWTRAPCSGQTEPGPSPGDACYIPQSPKPSKCRQPQRAKHNPPAVGSKLRRGRSAVVVNQGSRSEIAQAP